MSRTDLHFSVTTEDGKVSYTSYDTARDTWAQFVPITQLSEEGVKNVSVVNSAVSTNNIHVFSIDDSIPSRLRFTQKMDGGPFLPARLVTTAVGRAHCHVQSVTAPGNSTAFVWGLGGPTIPGRSFGLPAVLIDGARVGDLGDQLSRFDLGPIDPDDPAIAFERAADHLFLVTESGGLYFAQDRDGGAHKFEDLKMTVAGDPGHVVGLAVNARSSKFTATLNICVLNAAGQILHTFRNKAGSPGSDFWLPWGAPWGNVTAATRSSETFVQIATASFNGPDIPSDLVHLAAVTSTGGLFLSTRTGHDSPDPVWSPFVDVKSRAGDPGFVTSVDIDRTQGFFGIG